MADDGRAAVKYVALGFASGVLSVIAAVVLAAIYGSRHDRDGMGGW